MSEVNDRFVYQGVWLNEKHGATLGRTITTTTATSTIIVALLAVLSSIGTTHLWNLLLFAFHQQRASGAPRDALFLQQQALLRSLPAPGSFATEVVKLWSTWRHKEGRVLLRCLVPAFLALAFAASTITASVFSSAVVQSSNIEVLVKSPYCGLRRFNLTLDPESNEGDYTSTYETIGFSYARDCYNTAGGLRNGCNSIFVKPRIPFTVEDTECPFSETMCATKNASAVVMDSGLFSVSDNFGFNLKKKDDVKFRRRTTCSVLPVDGYIHFLGASDLNARQKMAYLTQPRLDTAIEEFEASLYGGYVNNNGTFYENATSGLQQATEVNSLLWSNNTDEYSLTGYMDLRNPFPCQEGKYCLKLRPELSRSDADVALMIIKIGNILHLQPIDDPLFAAHEEYVWGGYGSTYYLSDHHSGALACAVQYQVCISRSGKDDACTPLSGLKQDIWQNEFPEATDIQNFLLELLGNASWYIDFSNGLPDDQWKIEAVYQDSKIWAVLQILLTDYAIGPQATEPHAYNYVDPPKTSAEKSLCGVLKMKKSGGFANISVLGLSIIIGLSCTFVILDLVVLRSLIYIPKLRRRLAPRIDRWIQDGVYQFQRRAFEAHDRGMWEDLNKPVPTTVDMDRLAELPLESLPLNVWGIYGKDGDMHSVPPRVSSDSAAKPSLGADEAPLEERALSPIASIPDGRMVSEGDRTSLVSQRSLIPSISDVEEGQRQDTRR